MYMVIHDLKHPTESLINSVEQILKKFEDFQKQLKALSQMNNNQLGTSAQSQSFNRSKVDNSINRDRSINRS
jgi:hypothetical protein